MITPARLAGMLGARHVPIPAGLTRLAVRGSFAARLQPTNPGWVDLAMGSPLMDTGRAHSVLGWRPRSGAETAVTELLDGLAAGAGEDSAPLRPRRGTAQHVAGG